MSATKKTATEAAPQPTAYPTLNGLPVESLPYPVTLRAVDWIGGRRDGRIDLSGLSTTGVRPAPGALTTDDTAWLAHDRHREDERLRDEELAHQSRCAPLNIRKLTVAADLDDARGDAERAEGELRALPALSEEDATRRGAAETKTDEQVVRARRQREHESRVAAPARQAAEAARRRVAALSAELHQLEAQLTTLDEVTTKRKERLSELHERRRALYRRAYLRAHHRAQRKTRRKTHRSVHTEDLPNG